MKGAFLIIATFLLPLNLLAQNNDLKIQTIFYLNEKPIEGVRYYFINNNEAYLLSKEDDSIIVKDTLTTKGISLLAVFKNHNVVFPVYYYRESNFIKIYYDNRIIGNKVKNRFGIGCLKYLVRKEYYIDISGFDDIITVFKPKKNYKLMD